ncbi:MAG TPA: hypothetical protein VKX29_01275 [Brumimicrobium sp.]|nr:hypothetical protein [Brumimicrobium sp.]
MKKIKLSILVLGILFSSVAFAQEQKSELTKEQRKEQRVDKLAEELELTEEQKEQYIELRQIAYLERQKIRSDEMLDEDAKKSAMKELRSGNKEKLSELLTEEQALKLQAMKKERRANYKQRHAGEEKPRKIICTKEKPQLEKIKSEPIDH